MTTREVTITTFPVLKPSMRKTSGTPSTAPVAHSITTDCRSGPPSTPADVKETHTNECRMVEPKPVAPCRAGGVGGGGGGGEGQGLTVAGDSRCQPYESN